MEQLVNFETAKLAKEKNFPQNTRHKFLKGESVFDGINNPCFGESTVDIIAQPTQAHLQWWLRESFHIYCHVASNSLTVHFPMNEIVQVDGSQMAGPKYLVNFPSYETALEHGLQEALKMIK